jgi:hypothetical protein
MSGLVDLYAALAAIPVSAAGKTPTVYAVDALPTAVQTAQLPCRVLLPLGGRLRAEATGALALGGGQRIRWRLTDVLLWSPVGQGRSLAEHSAALVAYCDAYAAAVGIGTALDTADMRATVTGLTFEPGLVLYPPAGNVTYYGVECGVEVEMMT